MLRRKSRRIFGILALSAGFVLLMLEYDAYRQGGVMSWFWILVAALSIVIGLIDVSAKRESSEL